jgi:quercetin 2,3-dioxygenase
METIDVRPAGERFHTSMGWLDSWHSFSFSGHYDPANTHHGLLLVNNDDTVAPGAGFPTHAHRDMEIVTWVLSGELEHRDSEGNQGVIRPGLAQRMSAGRGIRHSEMNASTTMPVHFVQMWVLPDTEGVEPGYEQVDVSDRLDGGGLVKVAAGDGTGAVRIHQPAAALWVAQLSPGDRVTVPASPHTHVFVARGSGELEGVASLSRGDAVRLADAADHDLEAGDDGAEILVWTTR